MKRLYKFDPNLEKATSRLLQKRGVDILDSQKIAEAVLKLSDHYINDPLGRTPWACDWAQIAYLSYYVHLNEIRSRAVLSTAQKSGYPLPGSSVLDFGSGLGSGSYSARKLCKDILYVEVSPIAQKLHQEILLEISEINQEKWIPSLDKSQSLQNKVGIFSYSLTELKEAPPWIYNLDGFIIIEPATLDDGKKLLKLREQAIKKQFQIWAPCTHQSHCPLFEGKKDWCHDRVEIERPTWFSNIENHLPFQNPTITFSYLAAHRQCPPMPQNHVVRVVGDPLVEKGKTRQLICRNSDREFLAWLSRNHPHLESLDRGDLIVDPTPDLEKKSNEWRVPPGVKVRAL